MADPTLNFLQCTDGMGNRRMAYWQWGDAAAPHTVVCVHGLTRQGRDFDELARSLVERGQGRVQVLCPDVVGRGHSDWLDDPAGYQVPVYAQHMLALLAERRPATLDWVGTSMGGLIGLAVSAHIASVGCTLRRLVLNDVGPVLEWKSLQRIGSYLGVNMVFDNLEQAAQSMLAISRGFGPHSPEQWLALCRPMLRERPEGGLRMHYDPAIGAPFRALTEEAAAQGEAVLWAIYDALRCPTLLLRGQDSDLLSPATAAQMVQRGPQARLCEFAGVGHAPTLVAPEQRAAVCAFLLDEAPLGG